MRPLRVSLVPLLAAALTTVVAILPGTAGASAGSIWKVETTVNPEAGAVTDSTFASVSASGPADAWAVGTFSNHRALDEPLVEHWDGTAWSRLIVPQPAGQQATLSGVADLGSDDAWAVGTRFGGGVGATPAGLTLIEHWDGTTWSIVPSPNPAEGTPGDDDVLDAIAGTGPTDLWAVGSDVIEEDNTIQLLFEHWNGTTWTAVASPTPAGSFQFASSITAVAADDVWVVGSDKTDGSATLAAHWNGTTWSIVPTPDLTGHGDPQNDLTGVSAAGANDVWASGFADNVDEKNLAVPYVLHWTGKHWTLTKVPTLGAEGSRLNAVGVLSAADAWVVGQTQRDDGSILSLTEQYNGSDWTISDSPDPGSLGNLINNSLDAVAGGGGRTLFAVGARETQGQCCLRTLAIGTTRG
jgi:hypothetical protein